LPTILDNDLAPQLVAEYYLGAGRGRENFVILNIGTGLAMATFSGVVVRGHQSMAGQLHFHRHWVDSCSAWMPVEQILSGRGLLGRIAAASTRLGIEPHPTVGSLFEIGYRASQELPDELLQIRSDFIQHLARLIAEIGCFYAPEAIILTSGVSRSVPFFLDEVRARYEESRDPMVVAPEVVRSELTHLNCRGMWAIHTFGYPNHVVE
jgi:glucokinase